VTEARGEIEKSPIPDKSNPGFSWKRMIRIKKRRADAGNTGAEN